MAIRPAEEGGFFEKSTSFSEVRKITEQVTVLSFSLVFVLIEFHCFLFIELENGFILDFGFGRFDENV
jgi:hypothetical protein